jgi:hypothetical protein
MQKFLDFLFGRTKLIDRLTIYKLTIFKGNQHLAGLKLSVQKLNMVSVEQALVAIIDLSLPEKYILGCWAYEPKALPLTEIMVIPTLAWNMVYR